MDNTDDNGHDDFPLEEQGEDLSTASAENVPGVGYEAHHLRALVAAPRVSD